MLHRVLFRRHARRTLISAGQRFAIAGFCALGLAVVGVCFQVDRAGPGSYGQ